MEFRLIYEGKLKSNASGIEKHRIRQIFHEQLKNLYSFPPLNRWPSLIKLPPLEKGEYSSVKNVAGHHFGVLVDKELDLYCELDFLILKPYDKKGAFGDIDNKLKTIFDSLRYPDKPQEIPKDWVPSQDQNPLLCLIEDDELISKVNVQVDRLLRPSDNDVVTVIINVKLKGNGARLTTLDLII